MQSLLKQQENGALLGSHRARAAGNDSPSRHSGRSLEQFGDQRLPLSSDKMTGLPPNIHQALAEGATTFETQQYYGAPGSHEQRPLLVTSAEAKHHRSLPTTVLQFQSQIAGDQEGNLRKLRNIQQHTIGVTKGQQAHKSMAISRLVESYNYFKPELLSEEMVDDELDAVLDIPQKLRIELENVEADLVEADQIKLTQLWKRVTDEVNQGIHSQLLYSRDVPSLSMEINNAPLNKKKCTDQARWLTIRVSQVQETLQIVVLASADHDASIDSSSCIYQTFIDKESYDDMCAKQSILIPFTEFAERLATFLDYSVLHQNPAYAHLASKFLCIINESEDSEDLWTLYICERNEFRNLVHLQMNLERMTAEQRAQYLQTEKLIRSQVAETYLRQKVVLLQKRRESCQAMLEINENLKLLKDDHQRVIHEIKVSHASDMNDLRTSKDEVIDQLKAAHEGQQTTSRTQSEQKISQLVEQVQELKSLVQQTQSKYEKEQISTRNLTKELKEKAAANEQQNEELNEARADLQQQVKQITKLEKEKLHLTLNLEQSTKKCEELQEALDETKEQLRNQQNKVQNLNDQNASLSEKIIGLENTQDHLQDQIQRQNQELDAQKQETLKQKEKKGLLKVDIKSVNDQVNQREQHIMDLNQNVQNLQETIRNKEEEMKQKEEQQQMLMEKLKQTQQTLISNNCTIDELKQSLAEAQKFTFRALVNNRSSGNVASVTKTYQSAAPVNLSTTFNMRERQSVRLADVKEPSVLPKAPLEKPEEKESSQSAHMESRRLNDNATSSKKDHLTFSASMPKKHSESKSSAIQIQSEFRPQQPDRAVKVQDQSDLLPAERASFEQASQLMPRDTIVSQHKSTLGSVSNAQDQTVSINKYAVSTTHLQMPVTDYYLNKYGQSQSPKNFDDSIHDRSTENQLMLQARKKMQDMQMDQQSQGYMAAQQQPFGGSSNQTLNISGYYQQYRAGYSAGSGTPNAFAQQLERDRLMSMNKLSQNYAQTKNHSSGKEEDAHMYGGYRPQSNLSNSVQHYDQQRGQQSRQGPSFGSDERTRAIGHGLRQEDREGTLGPREVNQTSTEVQRIESKESANWGDSMDQKQM